MLDCNRKPLSLYQQKVIKAVFEQREVIAQLGFDFPEYGKIPKALSNKLPSGLVDEIQTYLPQLQEVETPREFAEYLDKDYLY